MKLFSLKSPKPLTIYQKITQQSIKQTKIKRQLFLVLFAILMITPMHLCYAKADSKFYTGLDFISARTNISDSSNGQTIQQGKKKSNNFSINAGYIFAREGRVSLKFDVFYDNLNLTPYTLDPSADQYDGHKINGMYGARFVVAVNLMSNLQAFAGFGMAQIEGHSYVTNIANDIYRKNSMSPSGVLNAGFLYSVNPSFAIKAEIQRTEFNSSSSSSLLSTSPLITMKYGLVFFL